MGMLPLGRPSKLRHRTRRGWQTRLIEALEGRTLLAASVLDPSFGVGGVVRHNSSVLAIQDVAVQSDGKIITADVWLGSNDYTTATPLVIHRYNANGSLDATFGTGGQTAIPFPGFSVFETATATLVLTATDQIVVAANATVNSAEVDDEVVRLTSTGALDTTFGTSGVVVLPRTLRQVRQVAVESNGRTVVAGIMPASGTTLSQVALLGLTSTGAIDPLFGSNGTVTVPSAVTVSGNGSQLGLGIGPLKVTKDNQLLLAVNASTQEYKIANQNQNTISRLTANGAIDTTFGGGTGTVDVTSSLDQLRDIGTQSDGRIIVAGRATFNVAGQPQIGPTLIRLNVNGTIDPTFAPTPLAPLDDDVSFQAIRVGTDNSITAVASFNLPTTDQSTGRQVNEIGAELYRFRADGTANSSFGRGGRTLVDVRPGGGDLSRGLQYNNALALTPVGNIVVGGQLYAAGANNGSFLFQARPILLPQVVNDYRGIGRSAPAVFLPQYGVFAASGLPSAINFGPAGAAPGTVIPVPGDYDGDGQTDPALYLANLGVVVARPSSGGSDVAVRFGPTGVGAAVPVPGDYDGDGRTDVALFLPASATFLCAPSSGAPPFAVQFGIPGAGNSIPATGDYDGSGKTELAVYLPTLGTLVYRPANGGADVAIPFGPAGVGAALPVPGDYDGDGRTDVALYLPGSSTFIVRPSSGAAPYPVTFGSAGTGASIPVPGDYDGDGKTDIAVFLTGPAVFAIAPSGGPAPYSQQYGAAGAGNTVPTTPVITSSGTVSSMSLRASAPADPNAGVVVFLPDDAPGRRKSSTSS